LFDDLTSKINQLFSKAKYIQLIKRQKYASKMLNFGILSCVEAVSKGHFHITARYEAISAQAVAVRLLCRTPG
jgi:hypothetical protein